MKLRSGSVKPALSIKPLRRRRQRKIQTPRSTPAPLPPQREHFTFKLPFTPQNIVQLNKLKTYQHFPYNSVADQFIDSWNTSHSDYSTSVQYVPNITHTVVITCGKLRVTNSDKVMKELPEIFLKAWKKFSNLGSNVSLRKHKKKSNSSTHRPGYYCGLLYNLLLVHDEYPDSKPHVWYGHGVPDCEDEYSYLPQQLLRTNEDARNFVEFAKHSPHLQMAQHWYQARFGRSEERVYAVLDLCFTFQQFIDDRNHIQNMNPLLRRIQYL